MVFMRNTILLVILSSIVLAVSAGAFVIETLLGINAMNYSMIVWNFALAMVAVIIAMTVAMYKRKPKKKAVYRRTDYY